MSTVLRLFDTGLWTREMDMSGPSRRVCSHSGKLVESLSRRATAWTCRGLQHAATVHRAPEQTSTLSGLYTIMARYTHSSSAHGPRVPPASDFTSRSTSTGAGDASTTTTTAAPFPLPLSSHLRRDLDIESDFDARPEQVHPTAQSIPDDPTLLPNGSRSLSSIGLQSFWTGFTLAASLLLAPYLSLSLDYSLWRLPAFLACLSLFHFLEYYTTARFNSPAARSSSFLIFSNGRQYTIAHSCAMLEICVSSFLPAYQQRFVWLPWTMVLGLVLVLVGQATRSIAMAQAGTNFNHTPAREKKEGHVLVTQGIYSLLRHPSYFGFFWWALGTQLLVGNKICLVGFALALWKFFDGRIRAEEKTLIQFFGEDYQVFRQRTPTGIPFVQ
nr:protein-s-isoprenylcysteine o-methyltransferase [Quercus suber]